MDGVTVEKCECIHSKWWSMATLRISSAFEPSMQSGILPPAARTCSSASASKEETTWNAPGAG